jgi:hypothetical protein
MIELKPQKSPLAAQLNRLTAHPYLTLTLAALALRLLTALVVRQPEFVDAYYYYQIAANWHAGKGLTETTIWNYQAGGQFDLLPGGQLDHPAFTYWTPLSSLLVILSFSLFGVSFWAASLPFMLCAVALAPLAYWLGRLLFGPEQRRYSWTMALVTLFPGRYFLYWNAPDNFAPFALISLLALAAIYGGLYHNDRWLLAAGGLLGLAYLSRSDGILLTVTLVLCFLLRRWQVSGFRFQVSGFRFQPDSTQHSALSTQHSALSTQHYKPRWWMLVGALGLALLVVTPWLGRNLAQFGTLFPASNLKMLFLRNYQEFFSYGLTLDTNHYLSWGWDNIFWHKIGTLGINALLLIFEGLFLLGPLFVIGLWATRKRTTFGPFMIYTGVLYLVMSIFFSEIGSHGTIFHSAGGLLPFQAGLALAGLEWLGRGKPRPRAAPILVLVAMSVTIYFVAVQQIPTWDNDYNAAQRLETWFERNATPKDVIMIGEPLSFQYASGRPTLSQASDGLEANLAVIQRYKPRWFVLGSERYGGLDDLYRNKHLTTNNLELRLIAEPDIGIQIYEILYK